MPVMRRLSLLFCIFVALLSRSASAALFLAQGIPITGVIAAANTNGNTGAPSTGSAVTFVLPAAHDAVAIGISGSYSATLLLQDTVDGSNWVTVAAPLVNVSTNDTLGISGSVTGIWTGFAAGQEGRIVCTAYSSGPVNVSIIASPSGYYNTSPSATQSIGFGWLEDVSYAASSPVNAHVSKASSATLNGFIVGNYTSGILYFQLFNSASTPTNGATPIRQWAVGIGVSTSPTYFSLGASYFGDGGLTGVFTSGLSWALSTSSGTLTLATASSCDVNVDYK